MCVSNTQYFVFASQRIENIQAAYSLVFGKHRKRVDCRFCCNFSSCIPFIYFSFILLHEFRFRFTWNTIAESFILRILFWGLTKREKKTRRHIIYNLAFISLAIVIVLLLYAKKSDKRRKQRRRRVILCTIADGDKHEYIE